LKTKSVVLDSSVWIEILRTGPLSKKCLGELKGANKIFVPTLVIFEVYRKILRASSEELALSAVALLNTHSSAPLSQEVALLAGDLSLQHSLATADSLVLAHAIDLGAVLVTLDNDFADIDGVKVIRP
jgi:toxin FitB